MNPFLKSLLPGLVLLGATSARATPTFPGVIQKELGLSSTPQCAVCHQGGQTAVGTVTTPFGAALRGKGLVFYNDASLRTALGALAAENVDSDGDGMSDVEELKADRDPNKNDATGGIDTGLPPEPFYGCAAAPGAPGALVLLGLGLLRRRRK